MKVFILFFTVFSFSNAYAESSPKAFILSGVVKKLSDGRLETQVLEGFRDSSFFYQDQEEALLKTFCYVGQVKSVCSLIDRYQIEMNQNYRDGDHDAMRDLQCQSKGASILATYRLLDDWGSDYKVTRHIERCPKN